MAASRKTVDADLARKGFRWDLATSAVAVAMVCIFATGFSTTGKRSYDTGNITISDVVKAFNTAGIRLTIQAEVHGVRPFQNFQYPIPHAKYTVEGFQYRYTASAKTAFAKNSDAWRYAGFAAMRKQNVAVVAVPWGHNIGMKGSPFAMPKLVRKAISLLP